ncbi:hypothetical protein [Ralstonia sp. SET104]|uniref:hypothetical protein n=1 Tax=Ralstonia sp. SET104 TaxID=2448774 RepID=UPI000F576EA5|nr:hypothetical protein [Ralstonia sp. SET104]
MRALTFQRAKSVLAEDGQEAWIFSFSTHRGKARHPSASVNIRWGDSAFPQERENTRIRIKRPDHCHVLQQGLFKTTPGAPWSRSLKSSLRHNAAQAQKTGHAARFWLAMAMRTQRSSRSRFFAMMSC